MAPGASAQLPTRVADQRAEGGQCLGPAPVVGPNAALACTLTWMLTG